MFINHLDEHLSDRLCFEPHAIFPRLLNPAIIAMDAHG
jgi:hypothetical protein